MNESAVQFGPFGGNGETPNEMVSKLRLCRIDNEVDHEFISRLALQQLGGKLQPLSPDELDQLRRMRWVYRDQIEEQA